MDTSTESRPALPRTVADPALVRATLADPSHTMPDPGTGAPPGTMAWLRQNVARLSNGADHERRRDVAVGLLRPLDLGLLRAGARKVTSTIIAAADRRPFDAMALVARRVPGVVLARALGAADPDLVVAQLPAVAAAYLPGSPGNAEADDCVARLTLLLPPGPGEQVAARIGLLIQAYAATAGLIGNAVAAGIREDHPVSGAQLVARVLRAETPGAIDPAGRPVRGDGHARPHRGGRRPGRAPGVRVRGARLPRLRARDRAGRGSCRAAAGALPLDRR